MSQRVREMLDEAVRRVPKRPGDLESVRERARRRTRRQRAGVVGAVAMVVAVGIVAAVMVRGPQPSAPFIGQSPDTGAATPRLHVEQILEGGFYTEGSFGYVEVFEAGSGDLAFEQVFTGEGPPVLDVELAAGRYRLVSFQRPCEASCPGGATPGGALDPPTDRCEATFESTPGATVVATISVTPGQGCAIDLDVVAAADAPQTPCRAEDVEVRVEAEAVASGATAVTVSLAHVGADVCTVTTGVRLALTDGQGHIEYEIEGNPNRRHVVEPLRPGAAVHLVAVWTSWCDDSAAVAQVDTTDHGSVSVDAPTPVCRSDATPQLRMVEPAGGGEPTAAEPAHARVDAEVDGAPPFYVDLGAIYPETDAKVWATHRLSIVSEWRTPIAISIADATVGFPQADTDDEAEIDLGQRTTRILQPNEETTITLGLAPGPDVPQTGRYTAVLDVPFWRDIDPEQPPAGQPDGTAIIRLTYELLADDEFAALQDFCEQAPGALQQATTTWLASEDGDVQALLEALTTLEAASAHLTNPQKDRLREEIEVLRDKLERLRDGERVGHGGHEGFDTTGVVSIVNRLCGTDVIATGAQP